jgi:hypothetical protein
MDGVLRSYTARTMPNNPYQSPAGTENRSGRTDVGNIPFVFGVGLISLISLAYVASCHATLLTAAFLRRLDQMNVVLSHPKLAEMHIAVCLAGGVTALSLSVHALRNREMIVGRRILWGFAIATGYGMILYWYRHIWSQTTRPT